MIIRPGIAIAAVGLITAAALSAAPRALAADPPSRVITLAGSL
jgi:hypothetical protein